MNNKKRVITILIGIYIILFAILAGFVMLFSKFNNEKFAQGYASLNKEVYSNNINDILINEKAMLDEGDTTGIIHDGKFTYKDKEYIINEDTLDKYNIVIFDGILFCLNDTHYSAYPLKELLNKAVLNTNASELVLMNRQGYIYYYGNDQINTNFNSYLDNGTTPDINNYLQNNNSGVIKAKRLNNTAYLSFQTLKDFNDLYYIQVFFEDDIKAEFLNNNIALILGVIIYTFFIIAIQIYIFKTIHVKNAEIENSKLRYYYTKPYVIKVNKRGKITGFNKKIKNDVENITLYQHVNELKTIGFQDDIEENYLQVLKEAPFTIEFSNKIIRFITARTNTGYYLMGEDITNVETNVDEMKSLAYVDQGSNQPNYFYLKMVLEKHLQSENFKPETTAAVILDTKNFTLIKEIFGRETSFEILKKIAKIIKEVAIKYDGELFNIEEDQFIVLFKNIKSHDEVIEFMKEVYNEVIKPLIVGKNTLNVQLNGGIYFYDTNLNQELTLKYLFNSLLASLKKTKESFAGYYTIYDETIELHISEEETMLKDLIHAIDTDEIDIYLQPQYNNYEQRIVGFEALARWNNPKYINRSPQEFILLAEKNNLIIEIGKIIMGKTFETAKKLLEYNVHVALNVSPAEILQDGFVENFLREFKKHKLKKNSISLEVTETFFITSLKEVNEKFKILRNAGIKIHLDDFGTGYSSLPYLRELEVDTIKIDRTFIRYLETDKKDREIVKMVISLLKALDYEIIAEGVESEYQNNFLYRQGCDIIQGYIVSPAVRYNDAIKLINEYNINKTKSLKVPERKRGIKL